MTPSQQKIVEEVITLLKGRYGTDTSGHDWFHLERVWKMTKLLAKNHAVNQFILEMAALLHDVDDFKFKKEGEEDLSGTRAILKQFFLDDKTSACILDIVSHVSYKGAGVVTEEKTIEGKIVQDADRLDAMGAIGIARVFTYGGYKGHAIYDPEIKPTLHQNFSEYKKQNNTQINHFYEKLLLLKERLNTPEAKKIGEHRHNFLELYLSEFFSEVEGEA